MSFVTEKNIFLPMRDGVRLATDVYRPAAEGRWPVLLARLMYDKSNEWFLGLNLDMAQALRAGYAIVVQDTRGRYASEGEFSLDFEQESTDGADTLAWIANQPWSTGNVGMFGGSQLGLVQWLAAREQPAALLAMAPMIAPSPASSWRHQGGALRLGAVVFVTLSQVAMGELQRRISQGRATPSDGAPLAEALGDLQRWYEHLPLVDLPPVQGLAPSYVDWVSHPLEEARRHANAPVEMYRQIQIPVLNISGWYDIFLDGTLENYQQMRRQGGSALARRHQRLLIGPWAHIDQSGVFPGRNYGKSASAEAIDLASVRLRWYDHWLKGIDNGVKQDKPVRIFVMGIDEWREEDDWPLPGTQFRPYYLHSHGQANTAAGDGVLSRELPGEEAEDVYRYDPRDPVPTVGGGSLAPLSALDVNVGPLDQRQVEARADVLCYTTPPLPQALEVTGPIELVLYVSSSAPDTDFTGKLVDVYPDGRAEILSDGILRARYRESLVAPVFMEPGRIYELHIPMRATANVFKAGHRLRLEVTSSNFPQFDRNSNTGGPIVTEGEKDLVPAINRIYHDRMHVSHLLLPIIERDQG
jgi:putative CocE/NonD family hydrolase